MNDDMLALAARVEVLGGADRITDCNIRITVLGDMPFGVVTDNRHQFVRSGTLSEYVDAYLDVINLDGAITDEEVPHYTASLDSAMTLVPEITRMRGLGEGKSGVWTADLASRDNHRCIAIGSGRTPALALVAASLRARASMGGKAT